MDSIRTDINHKIDELEAAMMEYPLVDCPLSHCFTPRLYTRTIFMPAGSLITSLIHKTEHQFIVSQGTAFVKVNEHEWEEISAPYVGITKPGTRRVLYIESDCVWTTVHPTEIKPKDNSEISVNEAVDLICAEIIEPHENTLLGGIVKNNIVTQTLNN